MKKIIKILIILLLIFFIILNFYKSKKNIFEDIVIMGLWDDSKFENEYEISSSNITSIDIFTTINNKFYRKIAPGCSGSFIIKFKKATNFEGKINIIEKTPKPKNLIFFLENNKYESLQEMEEIINQKIINTEKITINWEWKYYINENHDIQDTKDGKMAQNYIFDIQVFAE